jgi:hypothetical protein
VTRANDFENNCSTSCAFIDLYQRVYSINTQGQPLLKFLVWRVVNVLAAEAQFRQESYYNM